MNTGDPTASQRAALPDPVVTIEAMTRLLAQAISLRQEVREDIGNQRWGRDDIQMNQYNSFCRTLTWLCPADPVLSGQLIEMPDANLQWYAMNPMALPNDLPSIRLESRLTFLIDRVELLLNQPSQATPTRQARDVLAEVEAPEVQETIRELDRLVEQQGDRLPDIDVRDFSFVDDDAMRKVLVADYEEAQIAFAAAAYKASSLLCGGLIEGMLFDRLQRPAVSALTEYAAAISAFPSAAGSVIWDRVSMSQLLRAAGELRILDESVLRLSQGARDFRDTVHPRAEIREGIRAGREECELLLALVRLIYRNLSK